MKSSSSSINSSTWEHVDVAAKLADLKQDNYNTVLTLSAMLELLIEKKILTLEELESKASAIDKKLESIIFGAPHPKL